MAHLGSSNLADLLESVRHVIFFATPHHGIISVVELLGSLSPLALIATSGCSIKDLELWCGPSIEASVQFIGDVTHNFLWTTAVESEKRLGTRVHVQYIL